MKIYDEIEIIDLALKYKDILIMGDVQLGYEESMNKKGYLIPKFNLDEIIKRLDKIFSKVKVEKIIINGDIKHEFGEILKQEWNDVLKFIDYLLTKVKEIIFIKGNHDIALEPIARKRNIQIVEKYEIDNISILHGHKLLSDLRKIIIIGHEHPAVSFGEKKYEKYKCFLKGKFEKHTLIALPSFNFLTVGSDITKEQFLSPYLKESKIENFEVYAVEDKVYYFGKVKDLE